MNMDLDGTSHDGVVGAMPDENARDCEAEVAAPDDEDAFVLLLTA